jgi:serine/threonine-protein kinase
MPHPHYEILEECGHGGMGVVYKARDKRLNRTVALKFVLAAHEGSEEAIKRFRREVESIAALNHPNVATIYEAGVWDGKPFLAMEYLSGGSLATHRRPGGANYEELRRYAVELGGGLHFAHTRGILHRDVKPGNAMFGEHGGLKLVDFGLAKPRAAEDITRTGASVGTIAYMAPELLRGAEASVQSDVYAFGALLYEMAAGRVMFSANNIGGLVDQILRSPAVPLSTLRPDLPASFTEAVGRATALAPEDRFNSVRELLEQIAPPSGAGMSTCSLTVENAAPSGKPGHLKALLGAAAVLASLSIPAVLYFTARPAAQREQVVVVLPFENLGADPGNQALCDGLQETVTGLLAMAAGSHNLLLVPSSEVRRAQVRTIEDARKRFHADLAITGSAQETAVRLQLTLNLDDAVTLRQKDSRIVSVAKSGAADLQDKLAAELGSLFGYGSLSSGAARLAGERTTNSAAYALYLEGTGAVENRKADAAIDFLRKALDADPGFSLARAKLAEAYLWKNNASADPKWLALADAEVNRAAESGSGHETVMAQAMIRSATGDTESAIRLFRQLLQSEPNNMEAYQLLAQTLDAANRPLDAEATLRQAIRLRPGYWPLYNALGIFYMNRRQFGRAGDTFSSAAALAPDVPIIYSNQGALYFTMSRWSDAAASFEKSLSLAPNALAHANLATVLFYQGKYAEAEKHAEASTRLQPSNAVNWGNLGDARWQIPSERAAAREAFERAALLAGEQLSINPNNVSLRKSYALFLAKLGRTREAAEQIAMAISQDANDGNVQLYAARVFAVAGDTARARVALDRCKALGYSRDQIEREPDLAAINK